MKRITAIILVVLMLLCLCSCGKDNNGTQTDSQNTSAQTAAVDIHVAETGFVTSINEIYNNTASYKGQNIQIEGMFKSETYSYNGEKLTAHYVYRTGPGCCASDGATCGFEFESVNGKYPDTNDWIRVVGSLDTYTETNGEQVNTYLILRNATVTVLPESERGAETVAT